MCMTQRKNQYSNKYMNYYRTCLHFVRSMLGAKLPWLISTTYVMCDEDIERSYSEHSLSRLWENTRWLMSGWPRTKKQIHLYVVVVHLPLQICSLSFCAAHYLESWLSCTVNQASLSWDIQVEWNNGEPEKKKKKNENLGSFTSLVLPLPVSLNIIFLVGCVSYNRSQGSICYSMCVWSVIPFSIYLPIEIKKIIKNLGISW